MDNIRKGSSTLLPCKLIYHMRLIFASGKSYRFFAAVFALFIFSVSNGLPVYEGTSNANMMIRRYERSGQFGKAALWREAAAKCLISPADENEFMEALKTEVEGLIQNSGAEIQSRSKSTIQSYQEGGSARKPRHPCQVLVRLHHPGGSWLHMGSGRALRRGTLYDNHPDL